METGLYLKGPFLFFFSFPKSLLNLLQYCFSFIFWFFGCKVCGIFSSPAKDQTGTPALEGKVLSTGPPGKSLMGLFNTSDWTGFYMRADI